MNELDIRSCPPLTSYNVHLATSQPPHQWLNFCLIPSLYNWFFNCRHSSSSICLLVCKTTYRSFRFTHLLTSGINFLTHCTSPILLISFLSYMSHQLCHIIRHHSYLYRHPSLRPVFIPESKPTDLLDEFFPL